MSFVQMSLSGGVIILAVTVIRAVGLHRLPRAAFTALWAIAAARLLLPFSIPSPWSVYSLFNHTTPAVTVPASPVNVAVTANIPAVSQVNIIHYITTAATPVITVSLWAILWALGAIAIAAAFALSYGRCRRAFRASLPAEDDFLRQWLAGQNLHRIVTVRLSDAVRAPMTYGVLRPVILLPAAMDLEDHQTLDYVLAHELAHIRRFDAAAKLVLAAAACLHWFNPLVWVMVLLAGRDMELACDEAVIRRAGADARRDYARALLAMEERRAGLTAASFFSKNAIEERIVSIMKIKPKSVLSILLAVVLVFTTATSLATSANAAETPKRVNITSDTAQVTNEDAAMTELALRRLEDNYPNVARWVREVYPDTVWWTWEGYQAMMEKHLADLKSMLGQVIGSTSSTAQVTVTQDMINEQTAEYEQTVLKLRDGWMISKSVDGNDQIGLQFDPADIAAGTGPRQLQCYIELLDGTGMEFGPYETAGEMLLNIVPFLLGQVRAGNLDLEEARDIAACYESYTEGISRGTSYDGRTYVQWDDSGYLSITDEEFDLLFPTPDIQWWTAEEYAAWLEQEKLALQEVIGSQAWTNHDGWFTWTQEKVDETVAMYEKTLEDIKNGALISKTVDGSGDTILASGAMDMAVGFAVDDKDIMADVLEDRQAQWAETLAPYIPFGVGYFYDSDTDDFKLFWNGQEVRGITDETAQIWISEHTGIGSYGDDAIELYAVYENGVLTGVREATPAEQAAWTQIRRGLSISGSPAADIPPTEQPVTGGTAPSFGTVIPGEPATP